MKHAVILVVATLLALSVSGCSTKTYGRQGTLTNYEKNTMTCREVDLEIAKVRGFIDKVNTESQFSGKDMLAVAGGLGLGNVMEKKAALESANDRLKQLQDLRANKSCRKPAPAVGP